jgi:tRNA uridine 5-carboxymethylaminomethyl modification enzyme
MKIRPHNLAQAMRIPGVNYSDTAALLLWLKKQQKIERKAE